MNLRTVFATVLSTLSITAWGASQSVLTVPGQHATIQAAINAASPGDTVLVDPGTYVENIKFSDLEVRSVGGPAVTILDGSAVTPSPTVHIEAAGGTLVGFTVTNGTGIDLPNLSQPARRGGGVYCEDGTGTFVLRDLVVTGNVLSVQFWITAGAGVFCPQDTTIEDCVIAGNTCSGFLSWGLGAGISVWPAISPAPPATIRRCRIEQNTIASDAGIGLGGGVFTNHAVMESCVISGNVSMEAAALSAVPSSLATEVKIRGCTFHGNQSGFGSIVQNGLSSGPPISIVSTIVHGNSPPGISTPQFLVTTTWSNTEFAIPGTGNISAPPLFTDAANGDFTLLASSPCIDAGDPAAVASTDLQGNPRPAGAATDMGAHEFALDLYPGTKEDFSLEASTVGGTAQPGFPVKLGSAGDILQLHLVSPGGGFDFTIPILIGQAFATGSPPASPFPGIRVDPSATPDPIVLFDGTTVGGLVGFVLPPGGLTFAAPLPPAFVGGTSIMFQAFAINGPSANLIFTSSDGQEVRARP